MEPKPTRDDGRWSDDEVDPAVLRAIGRAGRELAWLDPSEIARMDVDERRRFLEARIVHYTDMVLHRDHVALWVIDARTRRLELIASQGVPDTAKCATIPIGLNDGGLPGYVAETGESVVCGDFAAEPQRRPLALADARSGLAVPVRVPEAVIGVLAFGSCRAGAFGDRDRRVLEIFAEYIALALNTMNLLTYERHNATRETTATFSSRLAGPLRDIHQEAEALMARYIGHDDMRVRLQRIVDTADDAGRVIETIAAQPPAAMMGTPDPSAVTDPILCGKRVLVADDEAMIRETISDVLQRTGAIVDVANDGRQAVERIESTRYDLVLSDIKMPYCSGYEVFAAAKRSNVDAAVILITGFGYDPSHSIMRANPEGLSAVLFKPFNVKQLLDEVHAALDANGS